MKTDFDIHVHVDLGVTPELVALVNAIVGHRQMPMVQQPSASEQPADQPEAAPAPAKKRGRKAAEQQAEAAPEAEAPEVAEQQAEQQEDAAPEAEQANEPKELTEQDVRDAMHRTRQRIEGENYKEETDGELYKKYHRALTSQFKNIAALLGADKPSALPLEQRASFIRQCDELIVENGEITTKVPY